MQLPKLSPGKRFGLPRPPGSADALLLARLAERERGQSQCAQPGGDFQIRMHA